MHVPAGWTTPKPGYWGDDGTGSETLEVLRTTREERDAWERAFYRQKDENMAFKDAMEARFNDLEKNLAVERAAWKREIRKAKGPGFGVFAGYGFNDRGDGDFVAGFGLVWRVW